jgi:hypothetical protein
MTSKLAFTTRQFSVSEGYSDPRLKRPISWISMHKPLIGIHVARCQRGRCSHCTPGIERYACTVPSGYDHTVTIDAQMSGVRGVAAFERPYEHVRQRPELPTRSDGERPESTLSDLHRLQQRCVAKRGSHPA